MPLECVSKHISTCTSFPKPIQKMIYRQGGGRVFLVPLPVSCSCSVGIPLLCGSSAWGGRGRGLRQKTGSGKGPPNPKPGTPMVGGSRGQKDQGRIFRKMLMFFMVFSHSPRRETPENVINKNQENLGVFRFFFDWFLYNNNSVRFFVKAFVVFLNSHR
jgi:hypothetical protein